MHLVLCSFLSESNSWLVRGICMLIWCIYLTTPLGVRMTINFLKLWSLYCLLLTPTLASLQAEKIIGHLAIKSTLLSLQASFINIWHHAGSLVFGDESALLPSKAWHLAFSSGLSLCFASLLDACRELLQLLELS